MRGGPVVAGGPADCAEAAAEAGLAVSAGAAMAGGPAGCAACQ